MSKDNEHDKVTAAYLVPLTEKGIEKLIRGKKKRLDLESHITYLSIFHITINFDNTPSIYLSLHFRVGMAAITCNK